MIFKKMNNLFEYIFRSWFARVKNVRQKMFRKSSKGGVISIQKIMLQILDLKTGIFWKKLQHDFPKMRGGSKAVWNFSENSSVLEGLGFPYVDQNPYMGPKQVFYC